MSWLLKAMARLVVESDHWPEHMREAAGLPPLDNPTWCPCPACPRHRLRKGES